MVRSSNLALATLLTSLVLLVPTTGQVANADLLDATAAGALAPDVRMFGFDLHPLGLAQLTAGQTGAGAPAVLGSNLGSSGNDGVSIAPPPPNDSALLQLRIEPTVAPVPAETLALEASGEVAGLPGSLGSALFTHGEDPVLQEVWSLTLDGSAQGAVSHTLQLFDRAWPVSSLVLFDGEALVLESGPQVVRYDVTQPGWSMIFDKPLLVRGVMTAIGFQPLELWASVLVCTPDVVAPGLSLSTLALTTTGVDELQVSGAALGFGGALATGEGGALLAAQAGRLSATNPLASSMNDGVSIAPQEHLGLSAAGTSLSLQPLANGGPGDPPHRCQRVVQRRGRRAGRTARGLCRRNPDAWGARLARLPGPGLRPRPATALLGLLLQPGGPGGGLGRPRQRADVHTGWGLRTSGPGAGRQRLGGRPGS